MQCFHCLTIPYKNISHFLPTHRILSNLIPKQTNKHEKCVLSDHTWRNAFCLLRIYPGVIWWNAFFSSVSPAVIRWNTFFLLQSKEKCVLSDHHWINAFSFRCIFHLWSDETHFFLLHSSKINQEEHHNTLFRTYRRNSSINNWKEKVYITCEEE